MKKIKHPITIIACMASITSCAGVAYSISLPITHTINNQAIITTVTNSVVNHHNILQTDNSLSTFIKNAYSLDLHHDIEQTINNDYEIVLHEATPADTNLVIIVSIAVVGAIILIIAAIVSYMHFKDKRNKKEAAQAAYDLAHPESDNSWCWADTYEDISEPFPINDREFDL